MQGRLQAAGRPAATPGWTHTDAVSRRCRLHARAASSGRHVRLALVTLIAKWVFRVQGGTPASVLGSRPLLPVMLMDTVNAFAPAGHRPVRTVLPIVPLSCLIIIQRDAQS